MKHYLITRFNLKNNTWNTKHSSSDPLDTKWLNARIKIFERICFPSVKNQSYQNFVWLVCFDQNTPEEYHAQINQWEEELPCFKALFINGFDNLNKDINQFIKNDTSFKDQYIITTRLDNDDSIHQDFIKTIQAAFKPEPCTIDIQTGYQLILKSNGVYDLRLLNLAYNPFISVVSPINDLKNVLSEEHHFWKTYYKTIVIRNKPLWLQFVHDSNVLNRTFKFAKMTTDLNSKDFGLSEINLPNHYFTVLFYNVFTWPYRLFSKLKLIILKK